MSSTTSTTLSDSSLLDDSKSDPTTTFNGYALMDLKESPLLRPYSYHPRPLGPHDIELSITHCGVCATDCHFAHNQYASVGLSTPTPLIVGHEIVGIIRQVGDKVSNVKVGDRVGVGPQCSSCNDTVSCDHCREGRDNVCPKTVHTYGFPYPDGTISQGGYSDGVRFQSHWATKIPEGLSSASAAPLFCAGSTLWNPLKTHGIGKKHSVGIVGLGGLGHIGVLISSKLAGNTWVVSTSDTKKADALKFGANHFVNLQDEKSVAEARGKMDILLVTSDAAEQNWDLYVSFLRFGGKLVLISVAKDFHLKTSLMLLFMNQISIHTSISGSTNDIREVLEFFAKNNISPQLEELPMKECNVAIQRITEGKARYRGVLHN